MTGVVAVVMIVEMDAFSSSSSSWSTPTDFLHRKMHGQQRSTRFAILYLVAPLADISSTTGRFSSFISLGHAQDLKIIFPQFISSITVLENSWSRS